MLPLQNKYYHNSILALIYTTKEIYSIIDLFCEHGFLRAMSHQRQRASDVRCNEKSISSKMYQR